MCSTAPARTQTPAPTHTQRTGRTKAHRLWPVSSGKPAEREQCTKAIELAERMDAARCRIGAAAACWQRAQSAQLCALAPALLCASHTHRRASRVSNRVCVRLAGDFISRIATELSELLLLHCANLLRVCSRYGAHNDHWRSLHSASLRLTHSAQHLSSRTLCTSAAAPAPLATGAQLPPVKLANKAEKNDQLARLYYQPPIPSLPLSQHDNYQYHYYCY